MGSFLRRVLPVLVCVAVLPGVVCAETNAPRVKGAETATSSAALAAIAERYFQDFVTLNPVAGSSMLGEARFEDKLEISISPSHRARSKALYERTQRELARLDQSKLSATDALNASLLREETATRLEAYNYPSHLLPVDQYGGLAVAIAQFGSGQDIQPLKTVKNYENYLKRLERLPQWVDQAIANMQEGMRTGVVMPRPLIESALPSLKEMTVKDVEKSVFSGAIKIMPDSFSPADRKRLTAAYRDATQKRLQPAMEKLVAFLEAKYVPACRTSAGIDALPNGRAWYAFQVRSQTTTAMTPDEIHALGLKEVARIRAEMNKIKAHYKFEGDVTAFLKWHFEQPQFRPFKTEQEILDAYGVLNTQLLKKLPDYFGRAPKAPLEIRAEPELTRATASDHYSSPAADGSRPGVFFTVIEDPAKYRTTGMTTLFLHEGQPGHHYHIAIQQELPLPKFRRHGWITAYGEGWALYAETLGREMGLYDDPNAYLGHLQDELLRAVRLVTDTGLHAKGWTREQTMKYMMENEGVPESEARRATERYMAWPGQALAYKIGALKIQQLRERASAKLGDRFVLKDFHDLILKDGVLPLRVLEAQVDRWIALQSSNRKS
ncbi:MAG: DUF885 domain-containing protein [Usitatibacteraceae bacterium]